MKKKINKKIVIGTIGAAILLILTPLSAGLGITNPNQYQKKDTPLCNTRINQVLNAQKDRKLLLQRP